MADTNHGGAEDEHAEIKLLNAEVVREVVFLLYLGVRRPYG